MRKTLLTSVAAVALVAGSTLGFAQGMNKGGDAPAASPSTGAPSGAAPAERSAPTTRGQGAEHQAPSGSMKGGQAEQKMPRANDSAQHDRDVKTKGAESESKHGGKAASESTRDKSKTDMKADTKTGADRDRNAAETKSGTERGRNAAETKSDTKAGATTGQAGAGAKLTSEQRTQITSVIHKQNVKPVTNVNFSISVGTRVPRTVEFHPVPTEIVTIYPAWRGYEFFLVRDEIVIVNPRTLEIVAVLPA
jgi:hypothetical protein